MPDDNATLQSDFENLVGKYNGPSEHEQHLSDWGVSAAIGHLGNGLKTVGSLAENLAEHNPATSALVGGITGKITQPEAGDIEHAGSLLGPRVGAAAKKYAEAPKPGVAGHLEAGLASGGLSLGKWMAFGKLAEGVNIVSTPIIDAISPTFRQVMVKSALGTKLAQVASGAAGAGAGTMGVNVIEGQKPAEGVGANMFIGGILGAATGNYSPETSSRIQQNASLIVQKAGGEKITRDISNIVDSVHKASMGQYSPQEATNAVRAVFHGEADPVQTQVVKNALQADPALHTDATGRHLWDVVNGNAKGHPPATEAQINEFLDAQEGGDFLSALFGGKDIGKGRDPVTGFPDVQPAPSRADEGFPNVRPAPGKEAPQTPEPFGTEVSISEPAEGALPGESRSVRVGASTDAGTPVSAPGIRYAIPSGADPKTDIPAAPLLTLPKDLTPSQKEIFTAAKGNDWKALEKVVTKGKGSATNLERMVTGDILKPEHITNSDVARQLAGHLLDRAEGLSPNGAKFHQLMEAADGFIDRASQLRGESTTPNGKFVREMESGDIVRTAKIDADNSVLVDKNGKSAIVANKDLPPSPKVKVEAPLLDPANAEALKQLEQLLGNNDSPPDAIAPKSKAGFVFPTEKTGLRGFSKGAVRIPRGKPATDPILNKVVARMGGKAFETPEGIVVKMGGVEQVFPDSDSAIYGLKSVVTNLRKDAEFEQVVDNAIKTDKIPVPKADPTMHKALQIAQKFTSQDAITKLPEFKSALLKPLTRFGATKGLRGFATQLGILKNMGEGGRDLATATLWYHNAEESLQGAWMNKTLAKNLDTIKKSGLTATQLRNGLGDPEAVKLYQETVSPVLNEMFKNAKALGLDTTSIFDQAGNTDKIYVPLTWDFAAKHLDDPSLLAEAGAMGMPSDPAELAKYFNNSDLAAKQTKTVDGKALDQAARARNVKWVQKHSASMAASLEKERKGHINYDEDIKNNVTRALLRGTKRLAEVASFGPDLDKALNNIARIEGFDNQQLAWGILDDSLGRRNVAAGNAITFFQDMARGKLSASWTKHIIQYPMMGAKEGFLPLMSGFVRTLAHPMISHEMASKIGAIIDRSRFDIVSGEATDSGGILNTVGKSVSNIGGFQLHKFVNTLRTVGTNVMAASFDMYYDKAMSGDADALAHLSDTFGSKISIEQLKEFNKGDLREAAMKMGADKAAGNFRPLDQPGIARDPLSGETSIIGKVIAQFTTIQYQLARNTIEPLINPNYSRQARVKNLVRTLIAAPVGGALASYLSKNVVGAPNMGEKELLHAADELIAGVHKHGVANISVARQAAFAELQSLVIYGAFGATSDYAQFAFTGGSWQDLERAPVAASVATQGIQGASAAVSLIRALGTGAHSSLLAKKEAQRRLADSVGGVFGGESIGFVRGKGLPAALFSKAKQAVGGKPYKGLPHKEAKPPKHQTLREIVTGGD